MREHDMTNKHILLLIVPIAFFTFLSGCGKESENPYASPNVAQTWNGIWVSSKVISSGTLSMTITQSDTAFSGSITMSGSPCFTTATVTGWTVVGNAVSWSSPEIGNFSGTISGASISGTYSVTAAGACFGDTGVFSIT
jgi:hypothetical protein